MTLPFALCVRLTFFAGHASPSHMPESELIKPVLDLGCLLEPFDAIR